MSAPLDVACPHCGSPAGEFCRGARNERRAPHAPRLAIARGVRGRQIAGVTRSTNRRANGKGGGRRDSSSRA